MPQLFGVGGGAKKKVLSTNRRDKTKKLQQEVIDESLDDDLSVLRLVIFEMFFGMDN